MSLKLKIPAKNELADTYNKFGSTISSLSRNYNVSNPTVRKWLKFHDIALKNQKQASTESNNSKRKNIPTKNELIELHHNKLKSAYDLTMIYGVGLQTIYIWLETHDINRRTLSESCSVAKKNQFKNIQFDKETIEFLLEKYDQNKILVADELNVSYSHIKKLIKKYDIISNYISYKSKPELEIYNFCKEIRPDLTWISGDKSIINPYEIDIYCPELKLGIEYCGLYWHSEYYGKKNSKYHHEKWIRCKNKGVDLLTIFEYDDIIKVKMLIKKKLGTVDRIYGRKTYVKEISKRDAHDFHNKYHLHKSVGSRINLGLYYEDKLVLVASFGKSRYNSKYDWECTRCTTHPELAVIGGVSKLFKYFIRKYNPESIITYADLRFGSGQVYAHCGFIEDGISNPNYWYFNKNNISQIYSRVNFQKHKLKYKLEVFDIEKTEYQNMILNQWDRIWDCGNMKYIWNKI